MLIRIRTLAVVALLALTAALTTQTAAAQNPPRATPKCAGKVATVTWDGRTVDRWGNRIIVGTPANDVIVGTSKDDIIYADGSYDTVCALGGDDTVYGDQNRQGSDQGYGNDVIYGGSGDDLLMGDAGDDRLYGQTGNDVLLGDKHGWRVGHDDRAYGGSGSDWCQDDNETMRSCELVIPGGPQ